MKIIKFIPALILTIYSFTLLHGQCGTSEKINIVDLPNESADTTDLSIVVENMINNNLANPLQGICGVAIRFKHDFVKELVLELISPSGQKVRLVGGTVSAYYTGFVTWDVIFVPSPPQGAAVPDPGFSEVWENDQDWENFTTYRGQYYPHQGRLQDFNTGPVNGTWTLRSIDLIDFGDGEILNFQLIFCDDAGAQCNICKKDAGDFIPFEQTYCKGNPELNLNVAKTFPRFPPTANNIYEYRNVVFKDGRIDRYINDTDFRTFNAGTYTVCGLQYAKSQSDKLPAPGTIFNSQSLNNNFSQSNLCAIVSDSCFQITILQDINPTNDLRHLCKGDTLEINGNQYFEAGIYPVIFNTGACDSLVNVDVRIIDIQVEIVPDRDSLNCLSNTISLSGANKGTFITNTQYRWFSTNSNFDSDTSDFIVDISKPGTYFLEISGNAFGLTCQDTASISIALDNSKPTLSLSSSLLTCTNDTLEIAVESSRPINNTIWESKEENLFEISGNTIKVWNPGLYILTLIADNGCSITDSIHISEDKLVSSPQFSTDTLNCLKDSVRISLLHPDTKIYQYDWSGVNTGSENQMNPWVSVEGQKTLMLTDLENGCIENFTTSVVKEIILPEITEVTVDTIKCNKLSVMPVLRSDMPISLYQWTGPGLISQSPSPSINNTGLFNVTITAENGCKRDTFFTVTADTIRPFITLNADPITCQQNEVSIIVTSNQLITAYQWTGPAMFTSNVSSPMVKRIGQYFVTVTSESGCSGTAQIIVQNGQDVPDITFSVGAISCILDTVSVNALIPPGNFTFLWSGPGLLDSFSATPRITLPGLHQVVITDVNTGCTSTSFVNIADNRIYPTATITAEEINCIKDSIQIILTPNMPLTQIEYSGPDDFFSNQQSPFVRRDGLYYVRYTNALSCSNLDSVLVTRNDELPVVFTPDVFIKCNQDSILLIGSSSLSGTSFEWKGPNGFQKSGNGVFAFSDGEYKLIGRAPNQCLDSVDFIIAYDTIPPAIMFTPPQILTCILPNLDLTVQSPTPGVSFTWEGFPGNTTAVLNVSMPGMYTVRAVAANNCIDSLNIEVKENKNFPVFTSNATEINCKDEISSAVITPEGDFEQIIWDNDNPEILPDGTLSFTTSFDGVFKFTIRNTEQCESTGEINIIRDTTPPIIVEVIQDSITCSVPIATVGVITEIPAQSYLWNGPGLTDTIAGSSIQVTEGGIYFVEITGFNFCKTVRSIQIIKNRDLPVFETFTDTLSCDNGKINIGVNPISNVVAYNWSGNNLSSTSRSPIVFATGTYTVTVTNSNGCNRTADVVVEGDFEKIEFDAPDVLLLPCDTSAIEFSVSSNEPIIRYKWTFPDGSLVSDSSPVSNQAGNYLVQVVGQNGCPSEIKIIEVKVDDRRPQFSFTNDTINCYKNAATLIAEAEEDDVSFFWTGPGGISFATSVVETSTPGDYLLVATNDQRCKDSLAFILTIDTIKPSVFIEQFGSIQCESKTVNLLSTGSSTGSQIQYQWSTTNGNILTNVRNPNITVNEIGLYILNILNTQNGCNNFLQFEVSPTTQQLSQIFATISNPLCKDFLNGRIFIDSINGFAPYSIVLNGQPHGDQRDFSFLGPGDYTFEITDRLGCKLERTLTVSEGPDPTVLLPDELSIAFGDSILLQPVINVGNGIDAEISWSTKGEIFCTDCPQAWVRPFINTVYTIEVNAGGRCKASKKILIRVNNDLNTSVPNIFRPTSLSGNDRFFIPQTRGIEKILSINVFDKWAENVYQANNLEPGDNTFGWDGTFRGKDVQPGVFVLVAEMLLSNGERYKYTGDLTLIR